MRKEIKFTFFGTSEEAVYVLETLYKKVLIPELVVTPPDRPAGRNYVLTPPLAKEWALEHNISTFQPEKLDDEAQKVIEEVGSDVFIVVGYGKIIPKSLINLPKNKILNVHPSLLPLYRGPTPVQSSILNGDGETGVSIILLDEEVDHGGIVAQEKYKMKGNETEPELSKILFTQGGELLAKILPDWIAGKIEPEEQDHTRATFTKKLEKEDGEINLNDDAIRNWRKFCAYAGWPRTFFFKEGKRIIITDASIENDKFVIKKVIPEGGKEQDYKD